MIRCLNCQKVLKLDETLTEKFPEWQVLTVNKKEASEIPQSQTGTSTDEISHLTTQVANLYDIICDSKSPLEQPMCQDCCDRLLDGMNLQLETLNEECDEYRKMLQSLTSNANSSAFDVTASRNELSKLKEKALRTELNRLEVEEQELERQLSQETKRAQSTLKEEERLWKSFRDLSRTLLDLETDEKSADAQLNYVKNQLERLTKTNVFNLTFHIWHSERFGTINGFRLGRLPDTQVDWAEINAAWGQTTLLLQSLARRLDFTFNGFSPIPMGNCSFILCLHEDLKGRELPLHYTGGYRFLGHSKFDQGMVAFLDCVNQLKSRIENHGAFHLPHAMQRDMIEDQGKEFSVKMQFNSEERWTKAMKCLLVNLKWALTFVAQIH